MPGLRGPGHAARGQPGDPRPRPPAEPSRGGRRRLAGHRRQPAVRPDDRRPGRGRGDRPGRSVRRPGRPPSPDHPPRRGRDLVPRAGGREGGPAGLLVPVQGALSGHRRGRSGLLRLPLEAPGHGRRRPLRRVHGRPAAGRCRGRPVPRPHPGPDQPLAAGPGPGLLQGAQAHRRRAAHRRRPGAGDPRPPDVPRGRRARLPLAGPRHAHPLRRREPADPPGQPDRQRADRGALRARRADHRPAPARQLAAARGPEAPPRPGQHAGPGGA